MVAVIAVVPSLVLFAVAPGNFMLALWVSNLVSFGMLFGAGWSCGHHSRMNPSKTGLAMLAAGGTLGLTAILPEK